MSLSVEIIHRKAWADVLSNGTVRFSMILYNGSPYIIYAQSRYELTLPDGTSQTVLGNIYIFNPGQTETMLTFYTPFETGFYTALADALYGLGPLTSTPTNSKTFQFKV